MGRFSNLAHIKTNQGGLYFLPGNYVVDLEAVKFMRSRKGVEMFIIETCVVESDVAERGPGSRPSQVIAIKEEILATCMGNIKHFAATVLGIEGDPDAYVPDDGTSVEDFWDEALEYIISAYNPLKGMRLRLNCTNIKTREGRDFTKHLWGPVVAQPGELSEASA